MQFSNSDAKFYGGVAVVSQEEAEQTNKEKNDFAEKMNTFFHIVDLINSLLWPRRRVI